MALEQNRSVNIPVRVVLDSLHDNLAVLGSAQRIGPGLERDGRLQCGCVRIPGLHIVPGVDPPEVSSQGGGNVGRVGIGIHRLIPIVTPCIFTCVGGGEGLGDLVTVGVDVSDGVIAIANGSFPTVIGVPGVPVARVIGVTVPSA